MAGGTAGRRNEELDPMLAAVLRRHVSPAMPGAAQDWAPALRRLHVVRLDREGITKLSNLEAVKEAHSLYLQENQIKKIENLEVLQNLQFLSLSGNKIEKVQNLRCLPNLQFLDLSNNLIQNLNPGEFPVSLLILDVSGNPCAKTKSYRQQILDALPHLQELDGVAVNVQSNQKKPLSEYEKDGSDSDDTSLLAEESDSLSSLAQDLLQRSHQRRKRALREHEDRLAEMNDSKDSQSFLVLQDKLSSAELPEISQPNLDSKVKASSQTKEPSAIGSNKTPLQEKNTTNPNKVGKAVFNNQAAASPTQFRTGVPTEKKLNTRPSPMSSRTLPSSKTQTKLPQTSKQSAEVTRGTASCTLKGRQTTNKIREIPEKTAAPKRSAMSAPNQRSALSAKKL